MNITLDGFISGTCGELDWHFGYWTGELADALCQQLTEADTILLGRVTYSAMAMYWPYKAVDPSFPREDAALADMMNNHAKIVFSKTLATARWNNATIVKGPVVKQIAKLKEGPGKNIILYGSARLASALIKHDLVDEYQLWVHPVVLGEGTSLFGGLRSKLNLQLIDTKTFDSGVVIGYYRPV